MKALVLVALLPALGFALSDNPAPALDWGSKEEPGSKRNDPLSRAERGECFKTPKAELLDDVGYRFADYAFDLDPVLDGLSDDLRVRLTDDVANYRLALYKADEIRKKDLGDAEKLDALSKTDAEGNFLRLEATLSEALDKASPDQKARIMEFLRADAAKNPPKAARGYADAVEGLGELAKLGAGSAQAMFASAEHRCLDNLRSMAERGAKLDLHDSDGRTIAVMAYARGDAQVAALLVKLGVDVDAPAKDGATLLWHAAKQNDADMIDFLLAMGADPEKRVKGRRLADLVGPIHVKRAPVRDYNEVARLDRILAPEREQLGRGALEWRPQPTDLQLPVLSLGTWDRVSELAQYWLGKDLLAFAGRVPEAGSIAQGPWEKDADFADRVSKARAEYEDLLKKRQAKVAGYPDWRRNAVIRAALSAVLGAPRIKDVQFDRADGTFVATIEGVGYYAKDFAQAFKLKEPTTSGQEAFEAALRAASPRVTFRREGNDIRPESASFELEGKTYEAAAVKPLGQKPSVVINLDPGGYASAVVPIDIHPAEPAPAPAPAALHSEIDDPPRPGVRRLRDYAVVVGVESYGDKDLPKASYAERDAEAVAANLALLGVPKDNVKLLTGKEATLAHIHGVIEEWLPKNVDARSTVYFYFSGHGAPDPETREGYLVPWDGKPDYLKTEGLAMAALYKDLAALKARRALVVADACFTGAGGRSVMSHGIRPLVSVEVDAVPQGVTSIVAAGPDQIARSLDDQGHGAFTYYFLKGLRDGAKDSAELCSYLAENVKAAAARQNGLQTPVCAGPAIEFK